ncbi:MAG: cytochrome B [Magnetococcales bacterium]|nr:cytochrome b/b6 domain-containing protein [Magnetococcales bacterium]NGZ07165.1 cytochrome B [Magnetococcales bacterium]
MSIHNQVLVWDLWVRLFHGLLAAGVIGLLILEESNMVVHVVVGYGLLGLLLFRVIWGWIGPEHARFRDFVRPLGAVLAYLQAVRTGEAPRHLGHNPAGGLMVVVLMVTLFGTMMSGILALAAPPDSWYESAHELLAGLMPILVVLHLGGVVFTSFHQRENLVKSMITGYKDRTEERA